MNITLTSTSPLEKRNCVMVCTCSKLRSVLYIIFSIIFNVLSYVDILSYPSYLLNSQYILMWGEDLNDQLLVVYCLNTDVKLGVCDVSAVIFNDNVASLYKHVY